jgi:hypothetical protein
MIGTLGRHCLGLTARWTGLAPEAEAGKARDYLNAPGETWVTFYNGGYSEWVTPAVGGSGVYTAGQKTNVISQSAILARIIDHWGRTGGVSIIAPYTVINGKFGDYEYHSDGLGDLSFAREVNLLGARALTREDMAHWKPETFASIHMVVGTPVTDYSSRQPVNTGSTAGPSIRPLHSHTFDEGWTWIEGYLGGKFFTGNPAGTAPPETMPPTPSGSASGQDFAPGRAASGCSTTTGRPPSRKASPIPRCGDSPSPRPGEPAALFRGSRSFHYASQPK